MANPKLKPKITPAQVASSVYGGLLDQSKKEFKKLSKHAKDRVFAALLDVPFEMEEAKFPHKEETACYYLIEKMTKAKLMMFLAACENDAKFVNMLKNDFKYEAKEK